MYRRTLIAALATAGCLGRGQSATPTPAPEPEPESTASPTPTPARLRQTVTVGEATPVECQVTGVRVESQVGGQSGEWVVVDVAYHNIANTTVTISSNLFGLLAGDSRYAHDLDAERGLDNALQYRQVQPGESGRGELVFPRPDVEPWLLRIEPVDVDDGDPKRVRLELKPE